MSVTAKEAYARVSDDLRRATGLPRACYLDDGLFAEEVEKIFRKDWLAVVRVSEVAKAGDYYSADVFGAPIVVTRGGDGVLRVLSRVCPHRAMPVVEGAGNATGFQCPYHAWRFGLDGALLSAPAMGQSDVFDVQACGLREIRHEVWQGWVMVTFDEAAVPVATRLAGLDPYLSEFDMNGLVEVGVLEFSSAWNWKVMVENFMESYHHIAAHGQTLQKSNPGLGTYVEDADGPFAVLQNPPASEDEMAFIVCAAFPSLLFSLTQGDVHMGVWYEMQIDEVDHFVLRIHLLMPPELAGEAALVDGFRAQIRGIHLEDIPVCEGVQKGLQSPLQQPGPYSHLEKANWQFHRYLADCLRGQRL